MYERFGKWLGTTVIAHPLKTIVLSLVIFASIALGLGRVRFSTDYKIFFSQDDPGLAAFEKLESVFTKTDNVLFVVKAKDGTVFTKDGLTAVSELTDAGWKLPHAVRVDSVTNFQHARATGDDIEVAPLVRDPRAADLESVRATALAEPILNGSLVSRDATTAAVNVTLRLPGKEPQEVTESADAARALVAAVQARHPELEIRPCGMAFMNDAFMQASVRDMAIMIPLMVLVMLVTMALLMRSAAATIAVATVIFLSAGGSMAVAGIFGYPLTPPSIAAPMMVLTVAIADGVHIVLAAMDGLREGKDKKTAIVDSIAQNLEAVTYTWLTTIVGFVCLNYSASPPVRHLANMTCFGVTLAFVWSITLLPAMLSVLPLRARRVAGPKKSVVIERIASFVLRRRAAILAVSAVITVSAGWLASRLETNDQFVQYFGHSLAFRRDVEFTMKNLSGIYRLEYQLGAGAPGAVTEPHYLERSDAFATWLRTQPEVDHVYGIQDVVKRVNQVMHDGEPSAYRIPESRAAASEALLVYEMGLPQGLDLTDRVNVDKSAARLTVTVKDMTSRQMTEFSHRTEAWLHVNAPPEMAAEATGPVVIFSQLSDRNARSMIEGDFVSLILVSICMIIVLRSVRLGLLSIVPNVIPIILGYGMWKLAVGQMNIVASVAGSISLGIIVDDTIHFLTKFQTLQRKYGLSAEEAMKKTLVHVGPAMVSTSAILVFGFGVLTLSSFQMTSYLGWLSVVIVGVAPLADLVLVPALVLIAMPRARVLALVRPLESAS
jgi:uncharacterized protein